MKRNHVVLVALTVLVLSGSLLLRARAAANDQTARRQKHIHSCLGLQSGNLTVPSVQSQARDPKNREKASKYFYSSHAFC